MIWRGSKLVCALVALATFTSVLFDAASARAQRRSAPPTSAPRVEFRPFVVVAAERFTAATTFDAVLGGSTQPMWGGGLQVVSRSHWFVDVAISRLSRTGERAVLINGEVFPIHIADRVALTPVEGTVGYRFSSTRRRTPRRRGITVIPYVGGGVGAYHYSETSDFSDPGEDVTATHVGFLAVGGAEFRVSKWVGITGDLQYTRVPGVLGQGGISKDAGERDLGGIAGRVRVILGR